MKMTAAEVADHARKHGFRNPLEPPASIPTPQLLMMVAGPDRIDFRMDFDPPETTAQQKGMRIVTPRDPMKKPFIHHFTKPKVEAAAALIGRHLTPFRPAKPFDGPLRLVAEWTWPWRTSENKGNRAAGWRWKDTLPDAGNAQKLLEDVMQSLGFYHDDAQIADVRVTKQWGDRPGIRITLAKLQQP